MRWRRGCSRPPPAPGDGPSVRSSIGIPETFELCTEIVRPGGHVANVGVHGKSATLHLERLWIKDVTITTGLVDTFSTPRLLHLTAAGKIDPSVFATHRFALDEAMAAYDAFEAASETGAFEVVLEGSKTRVGLANRASRAPLLEGWRERRGGVDGTPRSVVAVAPLGSFTFTV